MRLGAAVLPEQGSTAVLGGPAYYQLLLPVHVLLGQTVAAAVQDPRHVEWLPQPKTKGKVKHGFERKADEDGEGSRLPTLVEFLLGAVGGQSGSAGFRQGLSM